ncbi:hypothetical protein Pmani_017187 [Petrolisthes manimaculis]|uniref:Uncharacterized protein n=1 Tax=Petrolisthes manimaculis TaxID=1843537 RepID=A0AAE1PQ68_9EUCA|nr:hypothetical protein Pmani_017187 [Petrolisthes manimaculis]
MQACGPESLLSCVKDLEGRRRPGGDGFRVKKTNYVPACFQKVAKAVSDTGSEGYLCLFFYAERRNHQDPEPTRGQRYPKRNKRKKYKRSHDKTQSRLYRVFIPGQESLA